MKIKTTIRKVEHLPPKPFGNSHLAITCESPWSNCDDLSFRVKDTAAARRTYVIGREIEAEIKAR